MVALVVLAGHSCGSHTDLRGSSSACAVIPALTCIGRSPTGLCVGIEEALCWERLHSIVQQGA